MPLRNPRLGMGLSILFALLSGSGYFWLVSKKSPSPAQSQNLSTVVVAKKYLKPGNRISPADLEEKTIPSEYLQPAAFQKKSEMLTALGEPKYLPRIGLLKGEHLTRPKVIDETKQSDLSWCLTPDQTGLTIELDGDAAGGGLIRPGDFVSVFGVFDSQPGMIEPRAEMIEAKIQVVGINGRTLAVRESNSEKIQFKSISNDSILVTLSVTSRQAARILLVKAKGRLALAFRPISDEAAERIKGVALSSLKNERGEE